MRDDVMDLLRRGETSGQERRRHGRLRCEYVDAHACHRPLGEVLDMSASGLRVRCRGKAMEPGRELSLVLRFGRGRLLVRCRVVWCEREGRRRSLVGLHFCEETPELRAALAQLRGRSGAPEAG